MAKFADDTMIDGALAVVSACTRQVVTSAQPANFAGIAAVAIADVVMAGGDFAIANGTSGRKVTVAAKAGVTIDASATATHVVLDNGTILRYGTTCTSQALVAAGTVDVPAWIIQIDDPT